jgi:leader peptidase (prepilin peptidase)/N-methyltransferase
LLEAFLAALAGLLIGSFLNVCVFRMPRDLSVAKPARSFCPACEHTIAWYDNIPLFSYVALRRRCRHCGTIIPLRYLLVELSTAMLFFGVVLWLGPTLEALKYCIYAAILVALIAMDFEERILADEFTLGGTFAGLILAWFVPMPIGLFQLLAPREWPSRALSVVEAALSAVVLSAVLWGIGAIYYKIRQREGLGLGDVKMVAMIGAFQGLAPALLTVAVGSVLGSVVGILYIVIKKEDASRYELPFGSFIGIAALLVAVWVRPG